MFRKRFRPKKFRKKGPLPTRKVFLYSFILFIISSIMTLWYVDKAIEPVIMSVAEYEIKRIATETIHESVDENIAKVDMKKIITNNEGSKDSSSSYSFNPVIYSELRANITKDIQKKLGIKQGNPFKTGSAKINDEQYNSVVYYIPLGVVTGNNLLSNFGPEIPVKMSVIGNVESDLRTKLTNAGINNVYYELIVDFDVNIQIVIPSFTEETKVSQEVTVGSLLIEGDVPSYYSNGNSSVAPAIMKENKE
ncbi:Sporulation protein YunB [Peribacillus sp. Bi96]|uniref:sporulation protein YunB n=1 Tax=unclassified Peribacillus TaxID=2675266 RepID=UPI001D6ADB80|nr:sporulation protein YunB [Peribacillus sp. Bi96]CAH0303244.1 Sporulation protein YunB [Peribacillus sp. Bi96]